MDEVKLHWCCGDIYLHGYLNIDIGGIPIELAAEEEIDNNSTTLDNYYKHPFIVDTEARQKAARPFITDRQLNILEPWPFADNSVQEIVMISCFEHFWPQQAEHIINEAHRVFAPGGRWIVDFPDVVETVRQFAGKNDEHMMNLIYCNHKNEHSIHHWGYTKGSFRKLLDKKFEVGYDTIVQHDYPMIGAVAIKK